MNYQTNHEIELAFQFLQYTNQNVFLTGKAGTGKTTFLRELRHQSAKRMIVVAPTGVAAINAGGVTIHSFFQISFGPQIPQEAQSQHPQYQDQNVGFKRFSKDKINIIKSLDLLVIDEISMVRADVLDAIDSVLRRFKNRYQPFGGVQLLMIGDLQQLAPVVKEDEWSLLRRYYDTMYFFSSLALKQSDFVGIELKTIYRQNDEQFIQLLNKVRNNKLDTQAIQLLNARYVPNFKPSKSEGFITLTTHNYQADKINQTNLQEISTPIFKYRAHIEGEFPEYSYPTDAELALKIGAQVMFIKNDSSYEKQYYNGKIGEVVNCDDDFVEVRCAGDRYDIRIEKVEWQNAKYSINNQTKEIEEQVVGNFRQIPLKLAWAITIHKSQGLTFEKAIINARQSFAHGQVYVALSRCQTLDGLVLSSPIDERSVKSDSTVLSFTQKVENEIPGENELKIARKQFEYQLINDLFDFNGIMRLCKYCIRIWDENASNLLGNLKEKLEPTVVPSEIEIMEVARRFGPQVEELLRQNSLSDNEELQIRLIKGMSYFSQKMKAHIEEPFDAVTFQTDNKAIRNLLKDGVDKLEKEIAIKRACFNQLEKGFDVQKYLSVRALAAVESGTIPKSKTKSFEQTNHPDFFKQLIEWRENKADELNVTIARILSQKVMVEIANNLPASGDQLKAIKGMGGKKMTQFGSELLQLILDFRRNSNMEIPLGAFDDIALAGMSTKDLSLHLFRSGKNIREIARERKLAATTIEGHLAYFVSTEALDVFELVDKKTYSKIAEVAANDQFSSLSEVKKELPEEITYTQIKMVMADLGKY